MAETHHGFVALAAAGAAVGAARVGGQVAGDEDAVEAFLHRHVGCVVRHRGFGEAAEETGGGGFVLRLGWGRSAGVEGGEGVLEVWWGFGGGGVEEAGGIMLLGGLRWRDGCWWVDIGDAGVEVGGPLRWMARWCWG